MSTIRQKTVVVRGVEFVVREMKGTERFKCADVQEKEGTTGMVGFLLPRVVVKPEGFKCDDHPDTVVSTLFNEVIRLSDATDDDLEDAEKKSGAHLSVASGTD